MISTFTIEEARKLATGDDVSDVEKWVSIYENAEKNYSPAARVKVEKLIDNTLLGFIVKKTLKNLDDERAKA